MKLFSLSKQLYLQWIQRAVENLFANGVNDRILRVFVETVMTVLILMKVLSLYNIRKVKSVADLLAFMYYLLHISLYILTLARFCYWIKAIEQAAL